jgi:hypothetical protein
VEYVSGLKADWPKLQHGHFVGQQKDLEWPRRFAFVTPGKPNLEEPRFFGWDRARGIRVGVEILGEGGVCRSQDRGEAY